MNKQEIFDTVAAHLVTQGHQAKNEDGPCQYRAEDGSKCAVGCLIPDEIYSSDIEGTAFAEFDVCFPKIWEALGGGEFAELLTDLQWLHDERYVWGSEESLKENLAGVADAYELDFSVLETLHFPEKQ